MESPVLPKPIYRFGLFRVDRENGKLLRQGAPVKIQEQPLRVLCLLLERAGQIVTREELRQSLWPEGTYVEFDGSLNAALKRLRLALGDDADNPVFIETVPRRGYRFIAPVEIEEAPRAEPEPAVKILFSGTASEQKAGVASRTMNGWRIAFVTAAFVVLLVSIVASYHRIVSAKERSRAAAQKPIQMRPSLAILGFNNVSARPGDAWLGTALSEMLSTELGSGDKLRMVSGEDVANLRISAPWPQSTLRPETTVRIGKALNCDLMVLGSYASAGTNGDHLRIDVRMQDARTGAILSEFAETGSAQDVFSITSDVGAKLRQRIGIPAVAEEHATGLLASVPRDRDAARFYTLGLIKLRQFDALSAKDLLEQAAQADPKFPLVHVMLARAWSQLGYEQKRKEEAKKALDLSTDLPREERLLVEAGYYESLADHERAASAYRALFELFPDDVEYGLLLANAQIAAGHQSQASATIAQIRRLPPPASDDPHIDIVEAMAASGDRPAARRLLERAMRKAAAQGQTLIYARAEKDECATFVYGEHPDQISLCEDAYKIYMAAGNRLAAADAIRLIGDSRGSQGHVDEALATYQRALEILRQLRENSKTGIVLNNMAILVTNRGDFNRGEQLYAEARKHFEQAGNKYATATAIGNIGDIRYLRGDLPGAAKLYEQGLEIDRSLDRNDPSYFLLRLADLKLSQGLVPEAHRLAQQAVDSANSEPGSDAEQSRAIGEMGDILKAEGNFPAARQQYQSALQLMQKSGQIEGIGEDQAAIADLDLEEGQVEQAISLLRPTIAEFEKQKMDLDAASAHVLLSRALLMQGKLDEAGGEIQRAAKLAGTDSDPSLKFPIEIQAARVEAATAAGRAGKKMAFANALRKLHSVIAAAGKMGHYQFECEARLALAEAQFPADPARSRSQLELLAKETHDRGLEAYSRKARVLAANSSSSLSASSSPPR